MTQVTDSEKIHRNFEQNVSIYLSDEIKETDRVPEKKGYVTCK